MLRRAVLSTAVSLLVGLCAAPALADYRDDFANGVIALERGDYAEAIRLLGSAAKENSKESTQTVKLYGMRYTEYAPHFFLGIAYSKSGDCVNAIQELQESARQGIAQGKDPTQSKWGTIKDNLQQCITIGAKAPAPKTRPAESGAEKSAQNPPPRPTETAVVIAQAAPTRPPAPTPELVARAMAAPTAAPPPTRAPSPRPTIPSQPPAALLAAAEAYFRGDYAAAVKALGSTRYGDARTNAQALLFRSAASYGLFVLGGSTDKALEERAGRDARESSRLDPNLRVSQRAFSPRFLDFFARNRA